VIDNGDCGAIGGKNLKFEVLTAMTMKNATFWDVKTQFILHKKLVKFLLQNPAS
jgi:hypothetical protein